LDNYSILAFDYAAKQKGVESIVLDPEEFLEIAVSSMEDLFTKMVDGISVSPDHELDVNMRKWLMLQEFKITFENSLPAENTQLHFLCGLPI
jgi:hypothetical protein